MNIQVRKAGIDDVEMIARIGRISFNNAFRNVFNQYNLDVYLEKEYDRDTIAGSFKRVNNIYFIAQINDRTVGFAKLKKFSLNEDIESGAQMQLEKIYVLPGYQKRGAGNALLKAAIDFANDVDPDYLWLDVYAGNEQAIRLYERNGFVKGSTYHRGFGPQYVEFFMMMLPVHVNETLCC